jgi:hypothetical protein
MAMTRQQLEAEFYKQNPSAPSQDLSGFDLSYLEPRVGQPGSYLPQTANGQNYQQWRAELDQWKPTINYDTGGYDYKNSQTGQLITDAAYKQKATYPAGGLVGGPSKALVDSLYKNVYGIGYSPGYNMDTEGNVASPIYRNGAYDMSGVYDHSKDQITNDPRILDLAAMMASVKGPNYVPDAATLKSINDVTTNEISGQHDPHGLMAAGMPANLFRLIGTGVPAMAPVFQQFSATPQGSQLVAQGNQEQGKQMPSGSASGLREAIKGLGIGVGLPALGGAFLGAFGGGLGSLGAAGGAIPGSTGELLAANTLGGVSTDVAAGAAGAGAGAAGEAGLTAPGLMTMGPAGTEALGAGSSLAGGLGSLGTPLQAAGAAGSLASAAGGGGSVDQNGSDYALGQMTGNPGGLIPNNAMGNTAANLGAASGIAGAVNSGIAGAKSITGIPAIDNLLNSLTGSGAATGTYQFPWGDVFKGIAGAIGSSTASSDYLKAIHDAAAAADPFASQRPQYQQQFNDINSGKTDINQMPFMQNLTNTAVDNTAQRLSSKYGGDVSSLGVRNTVANNVNAANAPVAMNYLSQIGNAAGANINPQSGNILATGANNAYNQSQQTAGNLGFAANAAFNGQQPSFIDSLYRATQGQPATNAGLSSLFSG